MRTTKRYTNATFTKRVDHDAGQHRAPRAPKEPRVCERCGAVYANRRWMDPATTASAALRAVAAPISTTCPACLMEADGRWGGELRVSGGFLTAHRAELEQLLRNEAARAGQENPMARILAWRPDPDGRLNVLTTTEHLAKRLGQALHKAFRGAVHYEFSHENKFAHVTWQRDG